MKAIETAYKGYRFRSRLEARWAVFFDEMGIKWEYESQGFECSTRISDWYGKSTFWYLPDFWLPDHEIFAEVKGSLSHEELIKVLDAAAHLSTDGGGGCGTGPNTVVLGPVPDPSSMNPRFPVRLHMHKGDLEATPWNWLIRKGGWSCFCGETIARDVDGTCRKDAEELLLGGLLMTDHVSEFKDFTRHGYRAARSARFEHGESGYKPR